MMDAQKKAHLTGGFPNEVIMLHWLQLNWFRDFVLYQRGKYDSDGFALDAKLKVARILDLRIRYDYGKHSYPFPTVFMNKSVYIKLICDAQRANLNPEHVVRFVYWHDIKELGVGFPLLDRKVKTYLKSNPGYDYYREDMKIISADIPTVKPPIPRR